MPASLHAVNLFVLDAVSMPQYVLPRQLIYFGTVALSLEARSGAALAVFVYLNSRPSRIPRGTLDLTLI